MRSVTTCTSVTAPYGAKSSRSSCSVVENDRLPTYNFISFFESSYRAVPEHRVSNHHLRKPNLTIYRAIN